MELSVLSNAIAPTISRDIYMRAKQYEDVIDFSLGDPDIPTPEGICKAAACAAAKGITRYSPNAGIADLRQAIAHREQSLCGHPYKVENVLVTVGATEAVYLAFMSILNPRDEVIILAPYWVQYENIVSLFRGIPVIVDGLSKDVDLVISNLRKKITNRTKAIIVNSPNNPSGAVYPDSLLKHIGQIADEQDIYIISDETYRSLVYEGQFKSVASYCDIERCIIINSMSKQFAMTGWRIGYLVANDSIISTAVKFQQNIAVCVPTMNQYAAIEALAKEQKYSSTILETFRHRRNFISTLLLSCPKITFSPPQATFYLFMNIAATGMDSLPFCFSLLEKEHVAMIPGVAFGKDYNQYIRLAFTLQDEKIEEGINKLNHFLQHLEN